MRSSEMGCSQLGIIRKVSIFMIYIYMHLFKLFIVQY